MEHLDLAGVLTTPPQWNLPVFEQQDAIYLSSSRQMLEPIMEETSEDEEYALNSWQQYENSNNNSDVESAALEDKETSAGSESAAGGASFWSSAESDTGSVIRIEVNKDNDSTSERDFLCPAKRPRRCEESLLVQTAQAEEEVILRRPNVYNDLKNNSLERFLNYDLLSRDSWGAQSQPRSSLGSRRGFDDFYSDSDSLSYNSLSRSSSLIQFESLERQLLMQEQHASMSSLGNSSPSLLSFDLQNGEETQNKGANNSGNNSANNSRRGSQSSLLKKYESLDGRLHQTYYDLDKLNFDDMDPANNENFSLQTNLKITSHMAELRSDSESSSEGSEGSSRAQSVLTPGDLNGSDFFVKKYQRTNSQQSKKGKSSAENLSEDSGYCEPSLGFGLRKSKSQNLLKNYEKFSEEDEEMENKSIISHSTSAMAKQQTTFNELNVEQAKQHSNTLNEFKNNNTRQDVTQATPPLSPHLEFKRHKQRTEAHSPSPVSSEVSTSSSTSSTKSTSNNSTTSKASLSSSSSTASSTSSATTCASKASFTWLMPSSGRLNSRVYDQEDDHPQISINDLRELKTSQNENVEIFSGKLKNFNNSIDFPTTTSENNKKLGLLQENECLECRIKFEEYNQNFTTQCPKCGEYNSKNLPKSLKCYQCKQNEAKNSDLIKDYKKNFKENFENSENYENFENLYCGNCGEKLLTVNKKSETNTERFLRSEALRAKEYTKSFSCENLRKLEENIEFEEAKENQNLINKFDYNNIEKSPDLNKDFPDLDFSDHSLEYDSAVSTPESIKRLKSYDNSKNLDNTLVLESRLDRDLSVSSTPATTPHLLSLETNSLRNCPVSYSSDSDYSPLRLRKNLHNLMLNWPGKTSSVPNELNTVGRKKKFKKSKSATKQKPSKFPISPETEYETANDSLTASSEETEDSCKPIIKRSISWSCQLSPAAEVIPSQSSLEPSFCVEAKNLGLLHQSYHNLALLNLDLEDLATMDSKNLPPKIKADKRISSDYETEIVCKNNFLLDELSAHYDRTASILNDKPIDVVDAQQPPKLPLRLRKSSDTSYSEKEDNLEEDKIQHVQLVIRKPPARQKKEKDLEKSNSLTYEGKFSNIMKGALGPKTFDQDPTNLKTSYAQSLEKCNFDCKEISNQDLSKTRAIPKRRFHSQANNSKKKNMVSSTPNLNAFDFNEEEIEDDMFVSSAHTSMHQLPMSQTQKPLGILLPAGSRTSFGKEVSFCPVVSKYCWQEQSSEECNDGNEEIVEAGEDSVDELLDNADATVIYNTKENENIANKFNQEFLKKEQENVYQEEKEQDITKEKAVIRELKQKQQVENITVNKQEQETQERELEEKELKEKEPTENETLEQRVMENTEYTLNLESNNEKETQLNLENVNGKEENNVELELPASHELLLQTPVTTVSLTTNVNNETLNTNTDLNTSDQTKRVNTPSLIEQNNKPTVVVARPLSIQLPILSEPPINRAHHILYASQQMLDNFQKQQQNEEYEHYYKSQSTQNLSKMSSSKNNEIVQTSPSSLKNNNNDIMKSKFKHEEKHPNSKGFLSRFANNFRFSLRRNKKKLQKENVTEDVEDKRNSLPNLNKTNGLSQQQNSKSKSLPSQNKQPDFIHIPLKGPLPEKRYGNSSQQQINGNTAATNGNAKNLTVAKKGAKTKDSNDKQKVTGKPPIPPQQQHQQQQQFLKMQSAQSVTQQPQQQNQQQPLVEVGFSRFYTDTTPQPLPSTQEFLTTERFFNENTQQSCANSVSAITSNTNNENINENNEENIMSSTLTTNTPANYEFAASPSRATVSQKTQMFNNLSSRNSENQKNAPKIGLIETNLDTHETVITGKTRSLINIGPNNHYQPHQKLYAGNKRLHNHHHNATTNSHHPHHNGQDDDDDYYDDNDDDEVVVRPDGTVVVIKNAGSNNSSTSQAQQIASVRRPHKSMEFLLDKENQKDVMPPENELQKSHDHNPAALSEHQLRIQASLQRLNIPDWFRQYNQNQKSPEAGAGTGGASTYKPGNFTRKRTQDSGRWQGLNSKTTSLSSLGSQRSDRSPLLLSPSAHSHHGGQTAQHAGQHHPHANTATQASGGAFSRWSTSHLNSSQTSPSVSQRGSFSRGGPINSSFMSVNSGQSVIRNSMRQPYLGWRSQEKLSQRTAHERLASSLLSQQQRTSPTTRTVPNNDKLQPVTPEIQTSIKEVTSAIVHYVNDQTNQQRSRSTSPNSRKCWLESSFVGTRPLDSPQTPIIENTPLIAAAHAASLGSATLSSSSFRPLLNNNNNNLQLANHNIDGSINLSTFTGNDIQLTRMNGGLNNGGTSSSSGGVNLGVAPERSLSNASLEDVLASLLGLPTHQSGANPGSSLASDAYARSSTGGVLVSESQTPSKQLPQQQQHMPQKQQPLQQKENLQQLQVISKEEQQRLRRRSEGDAPSKQKHQQQQQQQQHQQQQQFEQKSQHYATNAKTYASDSITTVTNTNTTANGHAVGATAFLPPRRVSLGDSSESNNRTTSASGELQIKCRNNKCDRTSTPADAKKYYKSCHNCTYLYCSRECRRAHWEKHRKACLHSRVSNLCRQVLASCKDDNDSLRHLSLLARKGFLSQGRGVVRILFRSPESAEGFIKNGFQCMGEASYVRWPDLMPAEMGLELYSELLKLSTEYRPDSKMLVYVAVCVVSEAPGMGQAPVRWERQLVSRCAKLKLCKSVLADLEQQPQPLPQPVTVVAVPEPTTEVLILTFNPQRNSTTQRELVLSNILDILSRRGVILRKHYPEIYQRLQTYTEGQTDKFNPVTLHPRDSHTGQNFVCIIMPVQSETEIIKLPSIADGGNRVTTIDVGSSAALAQLDDDELLTRTTSATNSS